LIKRIILLLKVHEPMNMTTDKFTPAGPQDPERKEPPRRFSYPPPKMNTNWISRKWVDLAYGNESPNQRLDIYLPEQGDGPFPVIVAMHGGAFMGGDKADMQVTPMMSGLQNGYAVAPINYRLSGEAKFPAPIQDCKSAIRFLRANAAQYHLDPNKIAVWGASAGAHLAALVGTSPTIHELDDPAKADQYISCEVQAVVIWSGPTENFLKMDEEFHRSGRGTPDHSEEASPESRLMGRKITEIPELARKASPMSYITEDVPPFLIQHGELDHIVPVEQSIEFAAAIARTAGPERVALDVLPGVDHHGDPAFETDENIQRIWAFLDQCLLQRGAETAAESSI
jgi:acetyl esterase/lipase